MSIATSRRQDEELDELSASVERIGSVGLTIHDELHAQVLLSILKVILVILFVALTSYSKSLRHIC